MKKLKRVNKKAKTAASMTIHGPGRMTKQGRADIAQWLRQAAKNLAKDGDLYTKGMFRARFRYY